MAAYFWIDTAGWTWIMVIAVLLVGGYSKAPYYWTAIAGRSQFSSF